MDEDTIDETEDETTPSGVDDTTPCPCESEATAIAAYDEVIAPALAAIVEAIQSANMHAAFAFEHDNGTWQTQVTVIGGRPGIFGKAGDKPKLREAIGFRSDCNGK
jgi:hypothetical protein